MKSVTAFALVTASLCAGSAYASAPKPVAVVDGRPVARQAAVRGADPVGYPSRGGQPRTIQVVYDNLTNSFGPPFGTSGIVLGCTHVLDDLNFQPGPWGTGYAGTGRVATEISYGIQVSGTTVNPTVFDALFDFYAPSAFAGYGVNPMLSGASFQQVRFPISVNPGFVYQFTNSLTGLPGGGINFAANSSTSMEIRLVNAGTTALMFFASGAANSHNPAGQPAAAQIVFPFYVTCPVSPGSSIPDYGRDVNGNGVFEGGAPGGEHRGDIGAQQSYVVRFKGDAPPPPPPATIPIPPTGNLPDGLSTGTTTLAAGQVKWFQFTITGSATDVNQKYLDADTEGSTSGTGQVTPLIGIYDVNGNVIAADTLGHGSVSSALPPAQGESQLTLGIGTRAAFAPPGGVAGSQYNGRDGELPAGTYFVAVGMNPTSFGGSFTATSASTDTGNITLNIHTNVNAGALSPAVPPTVALADDYGVVVDPGFSGTAVASGLHGILWRKFQIQRGTATPAGTFLDLNMDGSTCSADSEVGLYDSLGNLVNREDDGGPAALSYLSYGAAGPRTNPAQTTCGGTADPLTGQFGNLNPGTYYIAMGLFPCTFDARWTARSTSGSNLNLNANITTNIQPAPPCPVDLTGDGVVNVQDFLRFLALYAAGNLQADFTGDGVVNVQDFLRFLALYAAGC